MKIKGTKMIRVYLDSSSMYLLDELMKRYRGSRSELIQLLISLSSNFLITIKSFTVNWCKHDKQVVSK